MNRPSIQFVEPLDLGPREWGTEELIVECEHYIGKKLTMKAGTAGGLQYHRRKVESFLLVSGEAGIDFETVLGDGSGLVSTSLALGSMIHVPAGAVHRVRAFTDCVFYEWSTPVYDDRVRVETEFGEAETGGLPTTPE